MCITCVNNGKKVVKAGKRDTAQTRVERIAKVSNYLVIVFYVIRTCTKALLELNPSFKYYIYFWVYSCQLFVLMTFNKL